MKRMYIAFLLLVLLAALCAVSYVGTSRVCSILVNKLETAKQLCLEGDLSGAQKATERFLEALRRSKHFLVLFQRKETLQTLHSTSVQLNSYLEPDNLSDYYATAALVEDLLQQLDEQSRSMLCFSSPGCPAEFH